MRPDDKTRLFVELDNASSKNPWVISGIFGMRDNQTVAEFLQFIDDDARKPVDIATESFNHEPYWKSKEIAKILVSLADTKMILKSEGNLDLAYKFEVLAAYFIHQELRGFNRNINSPESIALLKDGDTLAQSALKSMGIVLKDKPNPDAFIPQII